MGGCKSPPLYIYREIKMNLANISTELQDVAVFEMEHSGYKAKLMEAQKLIDNGHEHSLPPGESMCVIPIHCLPACPEGWVKEAGSYVVPVDVDKGIWFDWTMNDNNTAIVPSVKGMNPITGDKLEGMVLEQYRDKCPKRLFRWKNHFKYEDGRSFRGLFQG